MSDPGSPSPGEIGGVFAGLTALLVAFGGGAKWILGWTERRAASRSAKLDAWHAELKDRQEQLDAAEAEYQARIEARLKDLERENRALRMAFHLVGPTLRQIDPHNQQLAQAEALLSAAFPLDPMVPPDMAQIFHAID
ncbi:hypothetical protein [Sphingobium boeckii]|uniref:Uncharacterized protein n=1 Tax=Sphingobium boeckii TaxID=1082345 RepID=A0A7W9AEW9_9SPHN|nr:hypothetical protein [Sphingobium boeckii]MBB5684282.1 hypothetical protein [Sphingobium boeckii]